MENQALQRHARLNGLAAEDEAYRYWKRCYEEAAVSFEAYAAAQPETIRRLLWTYADAGRLMMQQKVNIACEHMQFPEEENRGAK